MRMMNDDLVVHHVDYIGWDIPLTFTVIDGDPYYAVVYPGYGLAITGELTWSELRRTADEQVEHAREQCRNIDSIERSAR